MRTECSDISSCKLSLSNCSLLMGSAILYKCVWKAMDVVWPRAAMYCMSPQVYIVNILYGSLLFVVYLQVFLQHGVCAVRCRRGGVLHSFQNLRVSSSVGGCADEVQWHIVL